MNDTLMLEKVKKSIAHAKKMYMTGDSIVLEAGGCRVWKKKLNDLQAIQKKIEWASAIRDRWFKKWNELTEEMKPLRSVWAKDKDADPDYLGKVLECSTDLNGLCGISTNFLQDNEESHLLITPDDKLPLLIGTLSPKGDQILERRIRGEIKGATERPDLIDRYSVIEDHLHRAGYFIRTCKQIILRYLYYKYHERLYQKPLQDCLIELNIRDKRYLYHQEGGRLVLQDLNKLITPDTITIKENI